MDFAVEYSNQLNIVEAINHVRIYKKMILPCELLGFLGNKETREMRHWEEPSSIRWKVGFEEVIKPHKRLVEEWSKFVTWLTSQEINTMIDFDDKIETKYEISVDRKYVKINNEIEEYYEAIECRYGQMIYVSVDQLEEINLRKSIAEMKPNKSIVVYSLFPPIWVKTSYNHSNVPFNDQITTSIEQNKAVAATDASVKGYSMGGYWILIDYDRETNI